MATAEVFAPIAAEERRHRTVVIGALLAATAAVMFFAGLIGIYVSIRQNNEFLVENGLGGSLWFPEGAVQIAPGTMMLFTTWIGAATISWAVQAVQNDDRPHAYWALGLTILMGAAVINQMAFAIGDFGLPVDRSTPALLLFILYGAYIAFLGSAIAFVFLVLIRVLAGQYDSRNSDGVQAAAIYWYATVIMYAVLWYVLTITK